MNGALLAMAVPPEDLRPTLEERYARATNSSHLEVTEHPGDVDKLIAAGWVSDGLGTTLYRLHVEYDAVRGEHLQAEQRMRVLEAQARAEAESVEVGPTRAWQMREDAKREAITLRALILVRLKTLAKAKNDLAEFALVEATKGRHWLDDRTVKIVAGRVLDVFLDPLCHHCQGRGFNGGFGEPKVFCRPCGGSSKRRGWIGRTPGEQDFARALLDEMDRSICTVAGQMKRFLRQNAPVA